MENEILRLLASHDIPCTPSAAAQFHNYYQLMVRWNEHTNLTSLVSYSEFAVKHILDSLLPARYVSIQDMDVADVGSGAGFPGLPLKIVWPSSRMWMFDASGKRVDFLEECCRVLDVQAHVIHARAEDAGRGQYRDRFDCVFARAVAPLSVLCEYCLPLTKTGGVFAALKGPRGVEEVQAAARAVSSLGGQVEAIHHYQLPGEINRTLIVVVKAHPTPEKYPRKPGQPAKKPL